MGCQNDSEALDVDIGLMQIFWHRFCPTSIFDLHIVYILYMYIYIL